jgi:cell division protein ZapE
LGKVFLAKRPIRFQRRHNAYCEGAPARRPARGVAWFAFADLCAKPARCRRLPRDHRSLCWVIVEGIPRLFSQQRNEARRFNILIDAL